MSLLWTPSFWLFGGFFSLFRFPNGHPALGTDDLILSSEVARLTRRPPGRFPAGFAHTGRCTNRRKNGGHALTDATRGQHRLGFLPWEGVIFDRIMRQPELPGDERHQIAPALVLDGLGKDRQGPMQASLGKAIPVIDGVTAGVERPPAFRR